MRKQYYKYFLTFLFILSALASHEEVFSLSDSGKVHITRTNIKITLDGRLTSEEWEKASIANHFWQKTPDVLPNANPRTEVRLLYDDKFLYVGVTCWDTIPKVIQSLKPDRRYWSSDGFSIVLDPMNEQTNGFLFGINPKGALSEALISTSSSDRLSFDWNNKWFGESQLLEDRWTAEMAIPFTTLRYEPGQLEWGVNFIRNAMNINQYHTWLEVPLQYPGIDLGYTGTMVWDEIPETKSRNITLIPFSSVSYQNNFQVAENPTNFNAGLDAKLSITKSLNLDITVNPDFSQVEIDEQITNLTRFSIFLPEKRTFFLENSDLFSSFGIPPIRPFFSRSIGLDKDGRAIPLRMGLRLTGNITEKSRIGLLNVVAAADQNNNNNLNNYTAASFSQAVWKRSTIRFMFTNRQKISNGEVDNNDFGRNLGTELKYVSESGDYSSWLTLFNSMKPEKYAENIFYSTGVRIQKRTWGILQDFSGVGSGFYADMGFLARIEQYDATNDQINRIGFHQSFTRLNYRIYPENRERIYQHNFESTNYISLNYDGSYSDRTTTLQYKVDFANSSVLSITASNYQPKALFTFYFKKDENKKPLPAAEYTFNDFKLRYRSDKRSALTYSSNVTYGGFYNGKKLSLKGAMNYRWLPWVDLGLSFEYNDLQFPEQYASTQINVFSSKFEINFNKKLFWTTFLQYINQTNQFNINSRIQWRYAPFSDIYLVYTDNYSSDGLWQGTPEHYTQAIVLKVNYWLNL